MRGSPDQKNLLQESFDNHDVEISNSHINMSQAEEAIEDLGLKGLSPEQSHHK